MECVGGPHDGVLVHVPVNKRNIIITSESGPASEYMLGQVNRLSPVLLCAERVMSMADIYALAAKRVKKAEYSGWLTGTELRYAKKLADQES